MQICHIYHSRENRFVPVTLPMTPTENSDLAYWSPMEKSVWPPTF